ncbi:MAG: Gfo/Idh/MocA family oxidoreductase [Verrucomicrobia bacterium]|nr:Gfo/Idh/MocA family oxidoreductase [Verrucomicrobiota bacterium]
MKPQSRRRFLKSTVGGGLGLLVLPAIIPARLFGADAPSRKLHVAQIGCGRMGCSDLGNVLTEPLARVVAVCDLDAKRLAAGKQMAEDYYTDLGESDVNVKAFSDYRDALASPEIDAVIISVPDHSHALVAIAAAIAGKHVYVQKPVTYSIAEAIALRKTVEAKQIILQTGSQQRSERPWRSFRAASEAVRNGRIGQLRTIQIGIGLDRASGKKPSPMSVPPNLDYERWLGPAPEQPYTITNWGSHHVDIAQWAMAQELGGPLTIDARAKFFQRDLVTVHGAYHVELLYPKNVRVILDHKFPTGIQFEGDEGWVFCTRSEDNSDGKPPLRASDKKILAPLDGNAVRWSPSRTHHGNWLESIVANRPPIAPIQQSARSLEACAAAWISMKLKRKLTWDVATERFVGDDAANALRDRPARKPEYDIKVVMQKAGLA